MRARASASSAPSARIRKLMVASEAVMPTSGTRPRAVRSGARSSASDSPRPKRLIVQLRTTLPASPEERSRGASSRSNIAFSSRGTPGRQATRARPSLIQMPGAVPVGLGRISDPSGMSAWMRLRSGMGRLRRAKRASIIRRASSSWTRPTPAAFASASRVRSSCVGPSPPLETTSSERPEAALKAAMLSSRSSPSTVVNRTGTPRPASRVQSHWPLVSSFSPLVSSLPMISSSARMGRGLGKEEE